MEERFNAVYGVVSTASPYDAPHDEKCIAMQW
jgi:hypothetical protein